MTTLIVLLCVAAGFAILLLCPVTLCAAYGEQLSLRIGYLFLRYRVLPQAEGKKPAPQKTEEDKEKAEQEHKKNKFQEILEQRGLSGFFELMEQLGGVAIGAGKRLLRHMTVSRFEAAVAVGTEDAADTAMLYGAACGVVYTASAAVLGVVRCKRFSVAVTPDFDGKKSNVRFEARARIALIFLLALGIRAALQTLLLLRPSKAAS